MVAGPCKVARAARDCQGKQNSRCETDSTKRVKAQTNAVGRRDVRNMKTLVDSTT